MRDWWLRRVTKGMVNYEVIRDSEGVLRAVDCYDGPVRRRLRAPWSYRYENKRCPYCMATFSMVPDSKRYPSRDHVLPKSRFAHHKRVVIVCSRCNGDKRDLTPFEWLDELIISGDGRSAHLLRFMSDHVRDLTAAVVEKRAAAEKREVTRARAVDELAARQKQMFGRNFRGD